MYIYFVRIVFWIIVDLLLDFGKIPSTVFKTTLSIII